MNPRYHKLLAVALVALAAALFGTGFLVASRVSAARWSGGVDDLAWLRAEFGLGETEMERIRALHEGYRPGCQAMCDRIAAKKEELRMALAANETFSAGARAKLEEVASLRVQCQAQMLEHFEEVSREMPREQGRRYLATMRELTLGLHDRVEESMAGNGGHPHGRGPGHTHD